MIDPTFENLIRLQDVPKLKWLPPRRGGSRLNVSTPFRWAGRGCGGVRLETLRIGGALCTSEAALKRFFGKLTDPNSPTQPTGSSAAAEAADKQLAAAGF